MEFKVGDRVGLDAFLSNGYESKLLKGLSVNSVDELNYIENSFLFGTISGILHNKALIVWDENTHYSIKELVKFVTDRLISLEFLVPEDELKNRFKVQKDKVKIAQNELTLLFKELQEVYSKIEKVDTLNFPLKQFEGAYCLRDFIDGAGWSSSSLNNC
jgi:hypothetical protein